MSTIDLTHSLGMKGNVYPGTPLPEITSLATIEQDGYAELALKFTSHTGTHVDFPAHIIKEGKTSFDYSINDFIGKAIKIDCSHISSKIEKKDIHVYEDLILDVDMILFYTGWQKYWGEKAYLQNYPILTKEASSYIASFSSIKMVGFDTISPDIIGGSQLPNHQLFLGKEILIIENLTNLDGLPNHIFQLYCIPLKINEAEASPVRAFATF